VDPQDLIDTWNGGTHVPPWLRGCNTVGRPFQTVIDELSKLNLMHLYRSQHVPALSVREVLLAHEGCRTRLLKIDTEGFDTILLVGYADFLWAHPECHADKVQFETMHSTAAQVAGAQAALEPAGYTQCGFEEDVGGGAADDGGRKRASLQVSFDKYERMRKAFVIRLTQQEEAVTSRLLAQDLEARGGASAAVRPPPGAP
jgi:hypothetical protein